ncbi:hypothetical protein HK104_003818 [Borealophlyctis nickersoniae]|nr:hypothetical protein HK104_003818 [Borealophlyctis nickersoniae]
MAMPATARPEPNLAYQNGYRQASPPRPVPCKETRWLERTREEHKREYAVQRARERSLQLQQQREKERQREERRVEQLAL